MPSQLTRKHKKYIKKYAHQVDVDKIASDLHISNTDITTYLIEQWGKEKFEKIQDRATDGATINTASDHIDIINFSSLKKLIRKYLYVFILLFVFVGFVYINSLPNTFVSDDIASISKNETINNISYIFQHPTVFLRVFTIYAVNKLFGLSPAAYRMVNILFHIGSVWLVFILLYKFTKKVNVAFIASALFAVHPILVESIAWISGGAYVQAGFFMLLSLLLYSLSERKTKLYVFSVIAFLSALLFSEKAMMFPGILILYELSYGNLKQNWKRLMPYFMFSLFYILYYFLQIGSRLDDLYLAYKDAKGYYNPFRQIPIALISYISLLVFPDKLALYHSELIFSVAVNIAFIVACISLFAYIIYAFKKNKFVFFWLSFFIISLSPTLTPFKISWIVAERYVYLGSIGVIAVLAFFLNKIIENKKWQTVGYILFYSIFVLFSLRTIYRNTDWKNEDVLWIATGKTSPSDPKTHNNLGDYYARHNDFVNAEKEFKLSIYLNKSYYDGYHNLGTTYWRMGKIDLAIEYWQKALLINPNIWQSNHSLAAAYLQKKDYKKSAEYLEGAIRIVPNNAQLYSELGIIREKMGLKREAIEAFTKALQLDPNNIQVRNKLKTLQ